MALNVPLLRQVMEHIEAHPEEHDQDCWARRTSCGTAYCFAGWAVRLGDPNAEVAWQPEDSTSAHLADGRGIDAAAASLLGMGRLDADLLFHPGNTVEDLRHYVDELIAEPTAPVASTGVPSAGGESPCASTAGR